jgi:hypothetical protein
MVYFPLIGHEPHRKRKNLDRAHKYQGDLISPTFRAGHTKRQQGDIISLLDTTRTSQKTTKIWVGGYT